jgi:hypothetical protein
VSWVTTAIAVAAAILIGVAMSYYHLARPGADLPLQLPEGAVLTKARDTITGFGYSAAGTRTDTAFNDAVEIEDIVELAGLPAARDAVREGTPVAYWRSGITQTASPSGGLEPAAGDFSVRLDPRGQLVAFATGYATDGAITHVDRARATAIGLEAIKKSFGIDASAYELEVVERSFPAGKSELTWRSRALKYGHVEQVRVNLQGDRLIMIERSLQRPRDYKAPPTPLLMQIVQGTGPVVLVGVFVIGWGFGLYYLFTTRNWDALTRRLPLAICALIVVQVGLQSIGNSGIFQSLVGLVAVTILLIGTVLPALSGVLLWIGRQSPERMWAAEQLTRGRVFAPAVSASLLDGVSGGLIIGALAVFADWAALQIPGFEPSISRELEAIDASFGSMLGETLTAAAFIVLGVAFAVQAFDRFRVNPIVSTVVIAIGAAAITITDQPHLMPGLVLLAGWGLAATVVVWLYRSRGFLAASIAGMVAGWLTTAMALRSLEDRDLAQLSSFLVAIVVMIAAAGAWGAGRRLVQKPVPLPA